MADKNKVRYGISNLHIAFVADDSETNAPKWDPPILVPGTVGLTPDAQSEEYQFYADNIAYFSRYSFGSYSGELEIALIPDAVLSQMFGWPIDEIGGLLELQGGKQRGFALMGQIQGDAAARRFVYYNCTAGTPAEEVTTVEEAIEVTPQTVSITMNPINLDANRVATKYSLTLDSTVPANVTAYNDFFNAVYIPLEPVTP